MACFRSSRALLTISCMRLATSKSKVPFTFKPKLPRCCCCENVFACFVDSQRGFALGRQNELTHTHTFVAHARRTLPTTLFSTSRGRRSILTTVRARVSRGRRKKISVFGNFFNLSHGLECAQPGPFALLSCEGFGGGHEIVDNLLFNTCRESGDHGAFNRWVSRND